MNKYFKIIQGRYTGFIGRPIDINDGKVLLLIQTKDQYFLRYVNANEIQQVKRWRLHFCGSNVFVREC